MTARAGWIPIKSSLLSGLSMFLHLTEEIAFSGPELNFPLHLRQSYGKIVPQILKTNLENGKSSGHFQQTVKITAPQTSKYAGDKDEIKIPIISFSNQHLLFI
jgi:hypothetical protein